MAVTTFEQSPKTETAAERFADWLGGLMMRMADASAGARAAREAGRLSQLSDQELARLGIARDRIVEHAFRGLIHS